jgi:hypothetical protein
MPWCIHVHGQPQQNVILETWYLNRDEVHDKFHELVHQMNCVQKGKWRRIVVYRQHKGRITTARRVYDYDGVVK